MSWLRGPAVAGRYLMLWKFLAMSKFKFPTDLDFVKKASKKVLDDLADVKLDELAIFHIKLCFEEAFINAVKYGSKSDSRLSVNIEVVKKDKEVEVVVSDQGKGFDFTQSSDPTTEENRDKLGGREVFLIKNLMDKVIFEKNGSCVRMVQKINA